MKITWEVPTPDVPRSRWGTVRLRPKGSIKLTHVIEVDHNFVKYASEEAFIRFVEDTARAMAKEFWGAIELVDE